MQKFFNQRNAWIHGSLNFTSIKLWSSRRFLVFRVFDVWDADWLRPILFIKFEWALWKHKISIIYTWLVSIIIWWLRWSTKKIVYKRSKPKIRDERWKWNKISSLVQWHRLVGSDSKKVPVSICANIVRLGWHFVLLPLISVIKGSFSDFLWWKSFRWQSF